MIDARDFFSGSSIFPMNNSPPNLLYDNQPPPQAPRNPVPVPIPIFSMEGNGGGIHLYNLLQREVTDKTFLDLGIISSDKLDDKFISNDPKCPYFISRARIKYNIFPSNRQDTSNKKESLKIKIAITYTLMNPPDKYI